MTMTPERKAEIISRQAELKGVGLIDGSLLDRHVGVVDELLDANAKHEALIKDLADMLEGCVDDLCSKEGAITKGCGRCNTIYDLLHRADKIGGGK